MTSTRLILRPNVRKRNHVTTAARDHCRVTNVADRYHVTNRDQRHVITEGHLDAIIEQDQRRVIVALQESDTLEAHPTHLHHLPIDPEIDTVADVTILSVTIHDVTEIHEEDPILVTGTVVDEAVQLTSTLSIKIFVVFLTNTVIPRLKE